MSALLAVAAFLLLGRALASIDRLPRETPAALTAWVLYVAWPAAALQSASLIRFDGVIISSAAWLWAVFAVAAVGVMLCIFIFGVRRPVAGAVLLASGAGSTAGFALPFIERYCGAECVATAIVLSVLGGALALSILGVAASCVLAQGRICVAEIVGRVCTFPPLIALMVGMLCPTSVLPDFANLALRDLGATLTPVSIVAIGMHLRHLPARSQFAPVIAALAFKLVGAPAVVLAGTLLAGPGEGSAGKLLVLLAAMPPLISAVAVAREYGFEPELSAQMAAIGASLALITVPLWGVVVERFL